MESCPEATIRFYLWQNEHTVVIGKNQSAQSEVHLAKLKEDKGTLARRTSGGGAVYHDLGNLNYCFISNKTDAPLSADFLLPVVHVLQKMNIPAEIGKRKDLWLPGGHKISGTASHVSKGRELHHGTLLYESNLEHLHRALNPEKRDLVAKATASVLSPVKNIGSFLQEKGEKNVLSFDDFVSRFIDESMKYFNVSELTSFSASDLEAIETLRQTKYSQREWNYKM